MAVMTLLLSYFLTLAPAGLAHADEGTNGERITRYDANATFSRNGTAHVVLNLTYDFATHQKHGPYLTFVAEQSLTDDPDHTRHVSYQDFHVSSPSGADPTMDLQNGSVIQLRIGSEDHTYTGEQKYRITYTVHGLIARDNKTSHLDEIDWHIFDNLNVPVDTSTVTVTAPNPISRIHCDVNNEKRCDSSGEGSTTATFSTTSVAANSTWRIVAGVPVGTFTSAADAKLTKVETHPTYGPWIQYGLLTACVITIGIAVRTGWSRDFEFVGEEPGYIPPPDLQRVRRRWHKPKSPVVVQPPTGIEPAQAGALLKGKADIECVTAGLLDLVVRRHLSITPEEPSGLFRKKPVWRLTRRKGDDRLVRWESRLLSSLLGIEDTVTTEELRYERDNQALPHAKHEIDELNDQMGLFASSHGKTQWIYLLAFLVASSPGHHSYCLIS